ncbi:MAG: iron-sulfur cluster assembly accessory protein [Firmicutes bacterium]|nr:iron-sulfur cluster assembly accessory protein [Bacillota bacterium]
MEIAVTVTPEALQAFSQLSQDRKAEYVRVTAAQTCGCGSIGYRMFWDDSLSDRDMTLQQGGLTLVIDEDSQPHVAGCVIDYRSEPLREGFMISNPNAGSGCGCGGH